MKLTKNARRFVAIAYEHAGLTRVSHARKQSRSQETYLNECLM